MAVEERKRATLNTVFLDTNKKLAYNFDNNIFRRSGMPKTWDEKIVEA